MNLIGDVEGRTAIMVDDMVDTQGPFAPQPTPSKSVVRQKSSLTARTPYYLARHSTTCAIPSGRAGRNRHHPAER